MVTRPCIGNAGIRRLRLVAVAVIGCSLFVSHAAHADLVPCVVYTCSEPGPIPNPLAETSGSAFASTTDGEAVVQTQQSVQWGLLLYTNLTPIHPLQVDSTPELPRAVAGRRGAEMFRSLTLMVMSCIRIARKTASALSHTAPLFRRP
jgi:hypothetical protein